MPESFDRGGSEDQDGPSLDGLAVPSRAGGRPWLDRLPPVLAEVWSLAAEEVATARARDQEAVEPRRREPAAGRPARPVHPRHLYQEDHLAADRPAQHELWDSLGASIDAYVIWCARVRVASPSITGRLSRVLDELAVYPKTVAPAWDWKPGDTTIRFSFRVKGAPHPAAAVIIARKALHYALRQARVGTPEPPPGVRNVSLAVELEEYPTVHFEDLAD